MLCRTHVLQKPLTKWEVDQAMMRAIAKYSTSAMDQMWAVILKVKRAQSCCVHAYVHIIVESYTCLFTCVFVHA